MDMDNVKFVPTPIETRHKYIRKVLADRFAQALKDDLAPMPVNNDKDLQGSDKEVLDSANYQKNRRNFPVNDELKSYSVWSAYGHPTRRFRRSNEFTKPDSEYFGSSQWRQM